MGEMVEFPSNGHRANGYLARPEGGSGPGLIVIQEWWGLVDHIKDVCDRFAAEGFHALAPDLYGGRTTTEPDEAGKLMMALNLEQAGRDMGGAIDHLRSIDGVTGDQVGVTGFCMGGGLALMLGTQRPDAIGAVVAFYGLIPWAHAQPDWSRIDCPVLGHFAGEDGFFTPDLARQLEATLTSLGKEARFVIHPGVEHAFFNDTRPEVYDAPTASAAWDETIAFFHANLG